MNVRERGFTLIEMLVIVAIMAVLSALLILYNRTGERQIILFNEQAKVLGMISRAKSLAVQTFNQEGVPCAYGVNFDSQAGRFLVFKDEAEDCRTADYRFERNGRDVVLEEFVLPPVLSFGEETTLRDVVFIPPDPKTAINGDFGLNEAAVVVKMKEGAHSRTIKVNSAGQITVQ